MKSRHKIKRRGTGLEVKTFKGKSGETYIVYRTPARSSNQHRYHVFVETEAKAAGRDCGGDGATTHHVWRSIWEKPS